MVNATVRPGTARPLNALFLHTGGLGDLVLASEWVAGFKRSFPGARLSLMCRAAFSAVERLYPTRPDEVIPLRFNPYAWLEPSAGLFDALAPVLNDLRARGFDTLVSGTLQPTWFDWFAASVLQPGVAVACTRTTEPADFLAHLSARFGMSRRGLERVELPVGAHERQRYGLLLQGLGAAPAAVFPWSLPTHLEALTRTRLEQFGFREREYLACFPSGSPGTRLKRWPEQSFATTLIAAARKWSLPLLLIGEVSDREALSSISNTLVSSGVVAQVFCGLPEDIPLLAGLLSSCRAYLGNDTGPMHLASAYGAPGVTIYGGGGHWPSYAPWCAGSVGLVNPLPCFGCDWDCAFGQGLCVEAVSIEAVSAALDQVLACPPEQASVVSLEAFPPALTNLMEMASKQYRAVQDDRAERLNVIFRQTLASAAADLRIRELEIAASERLEALQRADQLQRETASAAADACEALRRAETALRLSEQSLARVQDENVNLTGKLAASEGDRVRLQHEVFEFRNEDLLHFALRRIRRLPLRRSK